MMWHLLTLLPSGNVEHFVRPHVLNAVATTTSFHDFSTGYCLSGYILSFLHTKVSRKRCPTSGRHIPFRLNSSKWYGLKSKYGPHRKYITYLYQTNTIVFTTLSAIDERNCFFLEPSAANLAYSPMMFIVNLARTASSWPKNINIRVKQAVKLQ